MQPSVTRRALVIAVVLTLLTGFWVRQSEILVLATQVTESVPAIPSLTAITLLLLLNLVLKRIKGLRPFTTGEIIFVFFFVTISSTIIGIGVSQFLIGLIATPFYYTEGKVETLRPMLPSWLVVQDPVAVRRLFEGAVDGRVPWELWMRPALLWIGYFLALWWTLYCLMTLFYRAWAQDERLSFPLVSLPLAMAETEAGGQSFFRNRLMWAGFALSAVYNLINIWHAYVPSVPAIGKLVNIGEAFTALPWSAVNPFVFHFRPELIGLGYLVSTEISLTIWLSYLILKIGAVFAASQGYEPNQLYPMEQGIGAYLTLGVILTWAARRRLLSVWQEAWKGGKEVGPEGIRYRTAFVGLILGFLVLWVFTTAAGIAWWVSLLYLGIVLTVAVVYGRMRAQTGVPMIWLFPFHLQKSVMLYTVGSGPYAASGPNTLAAWALFTFLAKGYFPTLTGYQIEAMELGRRKNLSTRGLAWSLTLAVLLGLVLGWYHHLVPYYQHGAVHLRDGEIWGYWVSRPEYQSAVSYLNTAKKPDFPRIYATGTGSLLVALLSLLRLRYAAFPLHPLGYAMTACFGDVIWNAFLVVWLCKVLLLRYGGMRLYRQAIPFFLGFALGHFATAGVFWGLVGAWSGEAVRGYEVYFG